MDFHMSMSDMWLEYMVARNMNSSLSWSVLPHLPLRIYIDKKCVQTKTPASCSRLYLLVFFT